MFAPKNSSHPLHLPPVSFFRTRPSPTPLWFKLPSVILPLPTCFPLSECFLQYSMPKPSLPLNFKLSWNKGHILLFISLLQTQSVWHIFGAKLMFVELLMLPWWHSVMSDSLQPHGLEPARLFDPWNFPVERVAISYSRGSSWLRDRTHVSWSPALAGGFLTISAIVLKVNKTQSYIYFIKKKILLQP